MRTTLQAAILVMATAAVAACDRHPQNKTAYNNSGKTAEAGSVLNPVATPESPTAPATTPSAAAGGTSPGNVAMPATAPGGDEQTSAKILAEITGTSGMKESDVNVTTSNGIVKLGGVARSHDQVALAMDIAKRQPGVASVQSEISVQ